MEIKTIFEDNSFKPIERTKKIYLTAIKKVTIGTYMIYMTTKLLLMSFMFLSSLLIIGACAIAPKENTDIQLQINQNVTTGDSVSTSMDNEYYSNLSSDENLTSVVITDEEIQLYKIVMDYRQEKGLTSIPLSTSLTSVAKQHCLDLYTNKPDKSPCNAHSWSDKGVWTPCCYTPDHKNASCVWTKPAEMTDYKGYGYEIACGSSNPAYSSFVMTASYALKSWQGSSGHNAVILNLSPWEDRTWNAIGIGIYEGFACVWFGEEVDPAGTINVE